MGPRGVWALLEGDVGIWGDLLHPSVCPQVGNLKAHLKIHIADGPLKCRECGKQFTTSGSAGWWVTGDRDCSGGDRNHSGGNLESEEGFQPGHRGLNLKLWCCGHGA